MKKNILWFLAGAAMVAIFFMYKNAWHEAAIERHKNEARAWLHSYREHMAGDPEFFLNGIEENLKKLAKEGIAFNLDSLGTDSLELQKIKDDYTREEIKWRVEELGDDSLNLTDEEKDRLEYEIEFYLQKGGWKNLQEAGIK